MTDPAKIWDAFKNGDWEAFSWLYQEHFKILNNYGYKFTRDKTLIEDCIHDLFIKLWQNKTNLSSPASIRNYLFKSFRGIVFRKLQSNQKFIDPDTQTEYEFEVSYDDRIILREEEKELKEKLQTLIHHLSSRQREIIYLRFYEGLTYEEVADVMSLNINSTYKLLYKAIDNLRNAIGASSLPILVLLAP